MAGMSFPTPYERQFSFESFSSEFPNVPHRGADLDAEFAAVGVAVESTRTTVAGITDSDGALKRGSVGRAQLDSSVWLGFSPPAGWSASTVYTADTDTVFQGGAFYLCKTTHTSGAAFDAANWALLASFDLGSVLPDGAVTTPKMADSAVTTSKMAGSAVTTSKMASASVTSSKIAPNAVNLSHFALGLPTDIANLILPAGIMLDFAGAVVPSGWLLCYGQAVSRAAYPALFTALQTQFGAGDGTTTFNLPDLRGRTGVGRDNMGGVAAGRITTITAARGQSGGAERHTLSQTEMPAHGHTPTVTDGGHYHSYNEFETFAQASALGLTTASAVGVRNKTANTNSVLTGISVSIAEAGSGQSHNNLQPSFVQDVIIKAH